MKKIVIVCGLIAGLIVAAMMVITLAVYYKKGNFDNSMATGYATMIIAFSLIFVGIKNFRDKQNGGVISFGKAFMIGLYISLIASTIYVAVWSIEYNFFIPDFMDKYKEHMLVAQRTNGASPTEIAAKTKEMAAYKDMYKNPLFFVLLTYAEILPMGLLITLLSALILKRKLKSQVNLA